MWLGNVKRLEALERFVTQLNLKLVNSENYLEMESHLIM